MAQGLVENNLSVQHHHDRLAPDDAEQAQDCHTNRLIQDCAHPHSVGQDSVLDDNHGHHTEIPTSLCGLWAASKTLAHPPRLAALNDDARLLRNHTNDGADLNDGLYRRGNVEILLAPPERSHMGGMWDGQDT
jgi:hypothetical protein